MTRAKQTTAKPASAKGANGRASGDAGEAPVKHTRPASSQVNDIRASFLDFFARNDHAVLPSSPLVPRHDPTLMFTNSGMVPFKNVFTGAEKPRNSDGTGGWSTSRKVKVSTSRRSSKTRLVPVATFSPSRRSGSSRPSRSNRPTASGR